MSLLSLSSSASDMNKIRELAHSTSTAIKARDFLSLASINDEVANAIRQFIKENSVQHNEQAVFDLLLSSASNSDGSAEHDSSTILVQSLAQAEQSFLISDPKLPGHPIVYASPSFLKLTGFSMEEVKTLNQTMALHGPETDLETLAQVAKALEKLQPLSVRLRLYKKNRTPFWSQFFVSPLFDGSGQLDKFIAVHTILEEVDAGAPPELLLMPRRLFKPPKPLQRTPEAVAMAQRLRRILSEEFPDAPNAYFDQDFLIALANKKNRSFEDNLKNLRSTMKWRIANKVDYIEEADVAESLAEEDMFWHGFDRAGHPVFYLRPGIANMKKYNRELKFKAAVFRMEQGFQLMPPGITTCLLVCDAKGCGWSHFDTAMFLRGVEVATVGYRDRVERVILGPPSFLVNAAFKFVKPLLSEKILNKLVITKDPIDTLREFVEPKDIPTGLFK